MTPARPTAKPTPAKRQFKAVLQYADSIEHLERGHQWILPATPAAYEAQVEAMAKAWFKRSGPWVNGAGDSMAWKDAHKEPWLRGAGLALAAIGITAPPKGRK